MYMKNYKNEMKNTINKIENIIQKVLCDHEYEVIYNHRVPVFDDHGRIIEIYYERNYRCKKCKKQLIERTKWLN